MRVTKNILRKCRDVYQQEGLAALAKKILRKLKGAKVKDGRPVLPDVAKEYEQLQLGKATVYEKWRNLHKVSEEEKARQRQHAFPYMPLISIVVPVYNTKDEYLRALMDSVLAQTYARWELCMTDGLSTLPSVKKTLDEYAAKDKRISAIYLKENHGISGNTNEGLKLCHGEYVVFSDHDDLLEDTALFEVARAANEGAEVIYTDEDKVNFDSSVFYEPHLKPEYSPEKLESCNYFCHLTAVSRRIIDAVGMLDSRFDGSQDHEFVLRACDATDKIAHVPKVLYHWRQFGESMSKQHLEKCQAAGRLAVKEHLARLNREGEVGQAHGYRVVYPLPKTAKISVITVAHKKNPVVCENLFGKIAGVATEIIVVNKTGEELAADQRIVLTSEANDFAARNMAVKQSTGDYLLFIDENIASCSPNAVQELLMFAQLQEIGAVGGKIYVAGSENIFATNYIMGKKNVGRYFANHSKNVIGNGGMERITRNVSALPMELFMVKKTDFLKIGGFDERYQKYYGDADFCLRLLEAGLRNVFTPFAEFDLICGETAGGFLPQDNDDWKIFRENPLHLLDKYCRLSFEDEVKEAEDETVG